MINHDGKYQCSRCHRWFEIESLHGHSGYGNVTGKYLLCDKCLSIWREIWDRLLLVIFHSKKSDAFRDFLKGKEKEVVCFD